MTVDRAQSKESHVLESGHCHPSLRDKVEKRTEKTRHTFLDKMDVIAYGVQLWLEENACYSRRVAETTIDIAQELGIPEAEIERWVSSRLTRLIRDTEKLSAIKTRLQRIQESFLDQADNTEQPHRTIRSHAT